MKAHHLLATSFFAMSLLAIHSASAAPGSASSYNPPTGSTTTSTANPDGTHTVTVTDANGNSSSTVRGKPNDPKPKPPIGAKAFDPSTGRTTTSTRNADGSHTVR